MPFSVGDMIQQRHQRGAVPRLVVKLTDDPEVVWVHDLEQGLCRVFTWSHDLVQAATAETRHEAEERLSEGFDARAWK